MLKLSNQRLGEIAREEGILPEHLYAILDTENSPSDDTVAGTASASGERAYGRGQLLPSTFKEQMPEGDIKNPEDNARAAARYIKKGLDKNEGDFGSAAKYYFAGPGWKAKPQDKDYGGTTIQDYSNRAKTNFEKRQGVNSMSPDEITGDAIADLGGGSNFISEAEGKRIGNKMKLEDLTAVSERQLDDMQTAAPTLTERLQAGLRKQAESVTKQGELAATVELDKFAQKSKQAGENAAELSRLGLNLSDMDSLVASTSTQMVEDIKQARVMRADIDAKRNVGLFDSPLEYIVNQFTLPSQIREHNAVIQKVASQRNDIDQLSKVAKEAAGANALKYTDISFTGAMAAADLKREEATVKVAEIENKMLDVDYNHQLKLFNITQSRIKVLSDLQEKEDKGEIRRELGQLKADKEEAVRRVDQSVMVAAKMIGYNVPTMKELEKKPKKMKEAIEYVMSNNGGLGGDPLKAQEILIDGDPQNMSTAVLYQRNTLNDLRKQAEKSVLSGQQGEFLKNASPGARREALAVEMKKQVEHYANDPNFSLRPSLSNGAVDNPYHIPPLEVMTKIPETRALPLAKILTENKKVFPNIPQTDTLIAELAYANVGKDKAYKDITEAARDVAAYYREGIAFNNNQLHFNRFGMPEQSDYQVSRIGDMTNTAAVTKYYISKKRLEFTHPDFGEFSGPGTPKKSVEDRIKSGELK